MSAIGGASCLLRGSWLELRRDPILATTAIVILTGIGTFTNRLDDAVATPLILLLSAASFALEYLLIRRTMRLGGLLADDAPGAVAAFFGLLFVSCFAIGMGFVLLILPGIWLYARWLAAVPILFANRDYGVIEAMDESTRRSRPLMPGLLLVSVLVNLPFVIGLLITEVIYGEVRPNIATTILVNFVDFSSQILGWYLSIAAYRATQPEPLDAIFA